MQPVVCWKTAERKRTRAPTETKTGADRTKTDPAGISVGTRIEDVDESRGAESSGRGSKSPGWTVKDGGGEEKRRISERMKWRRPTFF